MEIIGFIGSILLAISMLPQVMLCFKQGHTKGLSKPTLLLMWIGSGLSVVATGMLIGWTSWPMANFAALFVFSSLILSFVLRPQGQA